MKIDRSTAYISHIMLSEHLQFLAQARFWLVSSSACIMNNFWVIFQCYRRKHAICRNMWVFTDHTNYALMRLIIESCSLAHLWLVPLSPSRSALFLASQHKSRTGRLVFWQPIRGDASVDHSMPQSCTLELDKRECNFHGVVQILNMITEVMRHLYLLESSDWCTRLAHATY